MQLFELVSPRLFRPLAGPNRAFYAELLLLLCIKRPVGPRQRAEQPRADQFKQLHGNVLSV